MPMLPIPAQFEALIATGRWPRTPQESLKQNLRPLVLQERIQTIALEETRIYFYPPPFRSVAEDAARNKYWFDPRSAPSEIDFDLALFIGDFGNGSDSPILLDCRAGSTTPKVLRLQWSDRPNDNHWVEVAPDFGTFAQKLGLISE